MLKNKKILQIIRQKTGKAISSYQLIEEGDEILVGVSGGKDSLLLLESLALRRKYAPVRYNLYAAHIKVKNINYFIDKEFFAEFCDSLNVPFIFKETEFDPTIKKDKTPCFACSWHRRKALFELTKELKCNKLALGHHLNDAVETLLLNMIYHASISSLPPKLKMFQGRMHLIRPLLLLSDNEIKTYAQIREFPTQIRQCPYDDKTRRTDMRQLIEHLEALNPAAAKNMFNAMASISTEYIPSQKINF